MRTCCQRRSGAGSRSWSPADPLSSSPNAAFATSRPRASTTNSRSTSTLEPLTTTSTDEPLQGPARERRIAEAFVRHVCFDLDERRKPRGPTDLRAGCRAVRREPCDGETRSRACLRLLAQLAVALGANVQPGQIVAVSSEAGKEAAHPGNRRGRVRTRRQVRRRAVTRPLREARAPASTPIATARVRAAVARRAGRAARRAARRPDLGARPGAPRRVGRHRPGAARHRPAASPEGVRPGWSTDDCQLDDHPVPDAGMGVARPPASWTSRSAGSALGRDRPRLPARRAGPAAAWRARIAQLDDVAARL